MFAICCSSARRRVLLVVSALVLVSTGSCRTGGSPHVAPTRTDRLRDAYPDLQKGPFALIADFETPIHYELFHASAQTPIAAVRPDATHGREDTGPGCLAFTASSRSDAVVVNNADATHWYLKRDWRQFDLLLLSVWAPRDGLMFDVAITSGRPPEEVTAEATLPLHSGWNALRLDLGELGEQITLDEVRELRFSLSNVDEPVTIYLDDLILSASREDVFGDSSNHTGQMYVQRVGRRWHVGAGGDFELIFANGQITGWYNLAADPYRLRNLVRGTSLGPTPTSLLDDRTADTATTQTSRQVVSRQAIREMNAVRVAIETEWRFVRERGAAPDERPDYRWIYTIYPTGQIYVSVEANAAPDANAAPGLDLTVSLAARPVDEWRTRVIPASSAERAGIAVELPAYITAQSATGDVFILFVPWMGEGRVDVRENRPSSFAPLSLFASYRGVAGNVRRAACHLWLGTKSDVSDREALERARAYATPAAIDARIGKFVESQSDSPVVRDGFAPASGTFALTPEGGRVLLALGSARRPFFGPVFSIRRLGDRQSWVYVNHLILEPTALDGTGNLIFQVPDGVREQMLIEVLLRQAQTRSGP